ncbi:MAG: hypothetical protein DRG78_02700 [Epsilonproteobacteria bacterium]|nr:MAG: hypothetical protein DRG78_02700 [Campylobacterota bacterium]
MAIKNKTVFMLIDAFRYDYLDRGLTPFLDSQKIKGQYTKKIIPGHGFCERAEMFGGKKPSESGFFTAIDLSKEENIYSRYSWVLNILNFINNIFNSKLINKIIRRLIWEVVNKTKHPMHPYRIPLNMLKYFSLTEDYIDMRKKNALGFESIFDYLNDKNLKYFYDSCTSLSLAQNGNDQDRLNLALKNANDDSSIYFVYIGSADAIAHKYGTTSKEINNTIQTIDSQMKDFVKDFSKINPDTKYIFLGDHGMIDIDTIVNAQEIIDDIMAKHQLKIELDYNIFLDSTLIRVWIKDKLNKEKIKKDFLLNSELTSNGIFLTQKLASDLKIPYDVHSADVMWWANPGVLISPDFFHTKNEVKKAMHGYLNTHKDSHGFCIVSGKNIDSSSVESEELTDIFSKLKDIE